MLKKSGLSCIGTLAAGLAMWGSAAVAHDIYPFECGDSGDSKSGYVNISHLLTNSLSTNAGGTSIPGFTMTNIDTGDAFNSASLSVNVFGKPNTVNGPYLFVSAHDSTGNTYFTDTYIGAGKLTSHSATEESYTFSYQTVGLPKGALVDQMVIQIYPSATAFNSKLYPDFNGATFTKHTKVLSECPGGAHP